MTIHGSLKDAVEELERTKHATVKRVPGCDDLVGGKRCGITAVNGLNEGDEPDGWWVGYSPRNGFNASVEGPWSDWVEMAQKILDEERRRRPQPDVQQALIEIRKIASERALYSEVYYKRIVEIADQALGNKS